MRARFKRLLVGLGLLAIAVQPAEAQENPYDGNWHFAFTPYLWIPGFDATFNFEIGQGRPEVDAGPTDILKLLQIAFMGAGEARKGNWSLFTDLIYINLSGNKGAVKTITGPGGIIEIPVNVATKTGLKGTVWTFAGGYALSRGPSFTADVLAGARYLSLRPSFEWGFATPSGLLQQSGRFDRGTDLWDALIGIKGRYTFNGGNWFIPYYADIGTGSSDFTGQAMAGVGYTFGWGDISFIYRYLYYSPGSSKVIKDLGLYGPALGVTFHF